MELCHHHHIVHLLKVIDVLLSWPVSCSVVTWGNHIRVPCWVSTLLCGECKCHIQKGWWCGHCSTTGECTSPTGFIWHSWISAPSALDRTWVPFTCWVFLLSWWLPSQTVDSMWVPLVHWLFCCPDHSLTRCLIDGECLLRSRTCELLPLYSSLTTLTLTAYLLTKLSCDSLMLTDPVMHYSSALWYAYRLSYWCCAMLTDTIRPESASLLYA
jgi:hypothetical protein